MTEYAFPSGSDTSRGVTLRDYFAAKALHGLLSNTEFDAIDTLHTARTAYAFADEMLKERSR
jgi:hypothetical protein